MGVGSGNRVSNHEEIDVSLCTLASWGSASFCVLELVSVGCCRTEHLTVEVVALVPIESATRATVARAPT